MNASNLQPNTSNGAKPPASISLDIDNLWSYMKTHGDQSWVKLPSYLEIFVPCVLDILERWGLRITFFVVGQDAALERNRSALKELAIKGHEFGNHSLQHEPWLHLYEKDQVRREIEETEIHIRNATGQKPVGFRGPGFSWSVDLLEVLAELGYSFDASTFPTYFGPIARMYYFSTSKLSEEEKADRANLFGKFKDGLRPLKAYQWLLPSGKTLMEIPVTTIPMIKAPFHLSYLIYLYRFSGILMTLYLNMAIYLCKMTGTEPSFLLHPLDLLGGDQVPQLKFFPGMDLSGERKAEIFHRVIGKLAKHFELCHMSGYRDILTKRANLKIVKAE